MRVGNCGSKRLRVLGVMVLVAMWNNVLMFGRVGLSVVYCRTGGSLLGELKRVSLRAPTSLSRMVAAM